MKRIWAAYRDLIGILFRESPWIVILTFACTITNGILSPLRIYINQNVFDGGLAVSGGEITFAEYSIYLVLFVIAAILPELMDGVIYNFVEPRSLLILRTTYRARMLQKLKTMKYEHFEKESSLEIIEKAYYRADNSARHLWPMYIYWNFSAMIASLGTFAYLANIRWWLVVTVLLPFLLETWIAARNNFNIYRELETYWKKERKYSVLGDYLRSRAYVKELKACENTDYLINTYKSRMNERNRDYERYYFKNLRKILLGENITKISAILHVVFLLVLFGNGQISAGLFIAMTTVMFGNIYDNLKSFAGFFKWSGMHVNTYEYYDKFFSLSDDSEGIKKTLPESFDIEFQDVWFRYPGTDRDILKGLSFRIENGEKASIVGENGEGKSTMIKLLLGLFTPDRGRILVGGFDLADYPLSVRTKIFGSVFQDFSRYSITIRENIGVGDIESLDDQEKLAAAAKKGKADHFAEKMPKGYDTLLGRDFKDGVDLSGGQWQRIALSRAFMGDKPILLLDEPTAQLDPMAEADLYQEFAQMTEDKTSLFITHRLGSTKITDRIFVIQGGVVAESGTHEELMQKGGIYAVMFQSQRQWYRHDDKSLQSAESARQNKTANLKTRMGSEEAPDGKDKKEEVAAHG